MLKNNQYIYNNNRGIALVLAVGFTMLVIAVLLQLNINARFAIQATAVTRERHTITYNSYTGIRIAEALLIMDKLYDTKEYDTMHDMWARKECIDDLLRRLPKGVGKPKTLKITDEIGKIQINALVEHSQPQNKVNDAQREKIWARMISDFVDNQNLNNSTIFPNLLSSSDVIDAIIDWIDQDDDTKEAENDYYEGEGLRPCPNDYFTDINELLYVKHFNSKIFNGLNIPRYVTVYGELKNEKNIYFNGLININTADINVLRLLISDGCEHLISEIDEFRKERNDDGGAMHDLSKVTTYYNEFSGSCFVKDLITVKSEFFRVESTAQINKTTKTITAILKREKDSKTNKWRCKIISIKDTS